MWWYLAGGAVAAAAALLSSDDKEEKSSNNDNMRKPNKKRSSISDFADDFEWYANGSDKLSYSQINDVKRNKICRQHKLLNDTAVYYFREYSSDWTFAVSEVGLSFMQENSETKKLDSIVFHWNIVDRVEYDSEDDVFFVYLENDDEPMEFDSYTLIKSSDEKYEFADLLSQMAALVVDIGDAIIEELSALMDENKWLEAIERCKELLAGELEDNVKSYVLMVLARCYNITAAGFRDEDKYDEARECNEKARDCINESLRLLYTDFSIYVAIEIYSDLGEYDIARRLAIGLMESDDKEFSDEAHTMYFNLTKIYCGSLNYFCERYEQDLKELESSNESPEDKEEFRQILAEEAAYRFTNITEPRERQFLMFVKDSNAIAGCNDDEGNIKYVFDMDAYPKDIVFPLGHPQANTLYMMHPMLHTHYLPCENIKETLFLDKVRDFCYVAQCLGATRVHFKAVKGEVLNTDSTASFDASASVGRKLVNLSGSVSENNKEHYNSVKNNGREWEYTFNPINKPFCPEDSVWLKSDTSWQQMVKMRLQGNQLSFTERITSSETLNMSSNQQRGVETSFSTLLWKASGKAEGKSEEIIFKSEESEYEISVTFKPMNEYIEVAAVENVEVVEIADTCDESLTPNEGKYKEEVLFYLEDDGEISSDERIILERKRKRFGITEERALAIEKMCAPSLTEAEQEYVDIYKELCADGEITERKRRLLNRERESLGISEKRGAELEAL
ncbi:MAG: hypothetical protein IKV77_02485 [Alistipes sp.]|nr:hypothetical protein [Alistipes sp.]